jgi:hypothetical protein
LKNGFQVELICYEFDNWSKSINETLKSQLQTVNIITIPAGRKPFFPWFHSVVKETLYRKFGIFFFLKNSILSQAISRRSDLLLKALNKASNPDLVIGHNVGALWVTVKAAEKFHCKIGFDVEDYHPGEGNNRYLQSLIKKLQYKLLPKFDYVSFAAPMILDAVKKELDVGIVNWFPILNYFPSSEFVEPVYINQGPIRLIWFSQNINAGRGLELILPMVKKATGKIELHLIGNLDPDFYEYYIKGFSNIIVHAAVAQKQLHHIMGQFDIGLALDIPIDKNRDLVITNKLLAYLQAGLYVLATNTAAQEAFLNKFPEHGLSFDYAINNSDEIFEKITAQINLIRSEKKKRYKKFEKYNWEIASVKLLNAWNNLL